MVLMLELNESATFSRKTPSFVSLTSIPLLNILENPLGINPLSNCGVLFVILFRAARAASLSVVDVLG